MPLAKNRIWKVAGLVVSALLVLSSILLIRFFGYNEYTGIFAILLVIGLICIATLLVTF